MRKGEYGLGVDVGDGAVSAAVCGPDDGAVPLRLGVGPVAAAIGDDGRVALVPAGGTAARAPMVARVGDPVPVYAGGRAVPAAELVADAVQQVRALAAEQEGRPDAWTVVTVPPSWAGHRCAALADALTAAGVPRFSLVSSAVAAVAAHVVAGDLPPEPTVAVYDLGAGTLDTAVVGPGEDRLLEHLAVPPARLPWGGRDVDDVVLAHVLDCRGTPDGDPGALRAACRAAKEALSTATVVSVDAGGVDGPVRLTREELDEVLAGPVRGSAEALAAAVAAAGLAADDLDAVVLTGGGVRVPLVAEAVSDALGRPLVVAGDPALTAALGAAALAADALAAEPPAGAAPADGPRAVSPTVEGTPALPQPRAPRGRTRPGSPPRAATRPGRRRGSRLGRGAVVAGLALGLLILGPAAAGLFDAVLTPGPAGQEATAQADDHSGDGAVVARGSAAVGGDATARAGGSAGRGAPRSAAEPTSSPRTSLAAAIATAARTGAPSAADSAAPTRDRPAPGTTALPAAPSPTPDGETPSSPASTGAPATGPTAGPSTSAPAEQPTGNGRPPTSQPPVSQPPTPQPPVSQPPVPEPPVSQPPVSEPPGSQPPASNPPAQQPPTSEAPVEESAPVVEQPATGQTDPGSAPTDAPATGSTASTGGAA
ncbi:Hsp70 protein [Geodermatophilus africanus]|uniref:Hsp70 protein n=1 Tax=Geodermatophilus africanus TaxID=1137993 RepID=A0A1H3KY75_9ACTN|nr:Hsp70 family protein [Geodermatophilus africanus]SDY57101.1 Hsp70 protein [Geodermatophilus africanus]